MSPTAMKVDAAALCETRPSNTPHPYAVNRLPVHCLAISRMRRSAAALRFSGRSDRPTANKPKPPSTPAIVSNMGLSP